MRNEVKGFIRKIFSIPRYLVFFLMTFSILLTSIFITSGQTYAASDGNWSDDKQSSIEHEGETYTKILDKERQILPKEAQANNSFIYIGSKSSTTQNTPFKVINVDKLSDPTDAKLFSFEMDTKKKVKKISGPDNIKISGVSTSGVGGCSVQGGASWLICPIVNTLAGGMDSLYEILQNFLDVQPLKTDDKSAIFQVWSYMRNLANILFVIFFIIVIYSQITNIGISNYGIKKMLPKLIIAAILINLSYYICAIAVDLSNILGHELQNILISIREEIFKNPNNTIERDTLSWGSIASTVLGGVGSIAYAGMTFSMYGGLGTVLLILGSLVGVVFSALVAIIILAARQAIIVVLIFLAPLAFAANVLPNTEKWFEKWKDLLTTMLVMYPIFAILFGGAQLAGTTIIMSSNGSIIVLILGMVVQVVPLVITPFLIRLSGSLLGKFAGMINNPNKGPFDKARNLANERAGIERNKRLSKAINMDEVNGKVRARGLGGRFSMMSYNHKRGKDLSEKQLASTQESIFSSKQSEMIANGQHERSIVYQSKLAEDMATSAAKGLDASYENFAAKLAKESIKIDPDSGEIKLDPSALQKYGKTATQLLTARNMSTANDDSIQNAKTLQTKQYYDQLSADQNLRQIAGGMARGEVGQKASLAMALSRQQKINDEEVGQVQKLLASMNLNGKDYEKIALGEGYIDENTGLRFDKEDKNTQKAALMPWMQKSDADHILDRLGETSATVTNKDGSTRKGQLHDIRAAAMAAYKDSGKKDEIGFIGNGPIDGIALNGMTQEAIDSLVYSKAAGISATTFAKQKPNTQEIIIKGIKAGKITDTSQIKKAMENILDNPNISAEFDADVNKNFEELVRLTQAMSSKQKEDANKK